MWKAPQAAFYSRFSHFHFGGEIFPEILCHKFSSPRRLIKLCLLFRENFLIFDANDYTVILFTSNLLFKVVS